MDHCEGQGAGETGRTEPGWGFSLSSPHVVTEEQGMCELPPERRFGAKILAEQARVPG